MSEDAVSLYRADDRLTVFPDPSEVFASRVEEHSRYFLPILKLDVSLACPDLQATLPIAIPMEPTPGWGALAENTTLYHTRLCFDDWMGWRLVDGRCEFLSDFRYFHRAFYEGSPPADAMHQEEANEIEEHYATTREAFELRREFFRKHGWVCTEPGTWDPAEKDGPDEWDSLVSVGGESFDGNWSGCGWPSELPINRYPDREKFPPTEHGSPDCGRVCPCSEDGRNFRYICGIEMWRYINDTNGFLLIFYDPVDQILVNVIDWS
ncbi:MAG: hypothetical protein H8E37_05090 [Planctomycetes bacterium]|nr:hypothetical protein [Planctomycetota bacterium]